MRDTLRDVQPATSYVGFPNEGTQYQNKESGNFFVLFFLFFLTSSVTTEKKTKNYEPKNFFFHLNGIRFWEKTPHHHKYGKSLLHYRPISGAHKSSKKICDSFLSSSSFFFLLAYFKLAIKWKIER